MQQATAILAALLVCAACGRTAGSSGNASGSDRANSSGVPTGSAAQSTAMLETVDPPEDLTPLAAVVKLPVGTRVKTRAYLWLTRPKCPPCPPGADCEPCPPPFFQFSENRHEGFTGAPGAVVLADFSGPEPKLDLKTEYLLEGVLEKSTSALPLLRIDKIAALRTSSSP